MRVFRHWLVGLLLALGPLDAAACADARLVRLLPLGVVQHDVLAVQLQQHRFDDGESRVAYEIRPSVVRLGAESRALWTLDPAEVAVGAAYERWLRGLLADATRAVSKLAGYLPAEPVAWGACSTVAGRCGDVANPFAGGVGWSLLPALDASADPITAADLSWLAVESWRVYRAADWRFSVVTLVDGPMEREDPEAPRSSEAARALPTPRTATDQVWEAQVPVHGWSVDVLNP